MTQNTTQDMLNSLMAHDRDRALCALLAPETLRPDLLALLAWNDELARVGELVTTEPMVGLIRQAWWREAIEEVLAGKKPRPHAVVQAVTHAVLAHHLPMNAFDTMVAARGADLEKAPFATLLELENYCADTAGVLQQLTIRITRESDLDDALHVGTAWGLIGTLRATHSLAHQNKLRLPTALLETAGIKQDDVLLGRHSPALAAIVKQIAELADEHLALLQKPSRLALLSKDYLKRLRKLGYNPYDPRVEHGRAWRAMKLWWS